MCEFMSRFGLPGLPGMSVVAALVIAVSGCATNQAGVPASDLTSVAPNPVGPIEVKVTSSAGKQLGKIE